MNTEIVILTTTFYKSTRELRFKLACEMISQAIENGCWVFIVDGSPKEIGDEFVKLGATVHKQTIPGIGPSRRQLFKIAYDIILYEHIGTFTFMGDDPIFIWNEPEKIDFINHIPKVIQPIFSGEADIVIPSRTEKSWASYPTFQVESEKKANAYFESLGYGFDIMMGPMAFTKKILPYFFNCNPAEIHGFDTYIQHIAPWLAQRSGYSVKTVPVDFIYPEEQRKEEEGLLNDEMLKKRAEQLKQCTTNFQLYFG